MKYKLGLFAAIAVEALAITVPSTAQPLHRVFIPIQTSNAPLSNVDQLLAGCPTAAELESIDATFQMSFESDPTSGVLVCHTSTGSRDLSRLQRTAYSALLITRHIRFNRPLPWTEKSLFDWFAGEMRGVRFQEMDPAGRCCEPERVIWVRADSYAADEFRWIVPSETPRRGVLSMVFIMLHEARHADGRHPHTCDNGLRDQTVEELGAYGVTYYFLLWLANHSDSTFFEAPPGNVPDWYQKVHRLNANGMRGAFCQPPEPVPTAAFGRVLPDLLLHEHVY